MSAIIAVCSCLTVVLGLVLCDASATAATGHEFLSSLREAPVGTALKEPGAVAVDHATGDVFVVDPPGGVVDVFSGTGSYLTQFGEGALEAVAVDEASGDVYVADPGASAVDVFKPDGVGGYELFSKWTGAGTLAGEFSEVAGVAVDDSSSSAAGDVYVVDSAQDVVDVFKPTPAGPQEADEGELVRTLTSAKLEEPNGVVVSTAAGTAGTVYVADSVKGAVDVFGAEGTYEKQQITGAGSPQGSFAGKEHEEGNVTGVAVDEATGDLLVAEAERRVVSEFNAAGEWVGWLTGAAPGRFGEPHGVAVGASGDIYVADPALGVVEAFGPGVVVPDVKTTKASKAERTAAMLNGSIDPDGKAASYRFEWGESEAYGHSTAVASAGEGETEANVTTVLEGLNSATTYEYRIVGENADGVNYGVNIEFTTHPAVSGVTTGLASKVEPSSVTLSGSLKPEGITTKYHFAYGETTSYGKDSAEEQTSASGTVTAEMGLSSLTPNTTYHYRLVAVNEYGTTLGSDREFTTAGPPRITGEPTTGIGHEAATLHARVNPDEIATSYHFEYGETNAYGTELPLGGANIGAGSESAAVAASLTGLTIGTIYHFRVVASNQAGITTGSDQTFETTPPAPVDAEYATEVGSGEATLHTQINPLGHDTTFYFQYGTETCVEHPGVCTEIPAPPGEDIGAGEEDVAKTVHLSALKPKTTYHYRVLAINSLGTTEGAEHTFTTQPEGTPFALPDGRAWEMVSPPDKQGAPVEGLTREGGLLLASEGGDALTYVVDGALGEDVQGDRSPEWQQVLATRNSRGWSSQDIATPSSKAEGVTAGQTPEYQFFTPDLSSALVQPAGQGAEPPLAPGVTQATMYVRNDVAGTYVPLVTEANVAPGTVFGAQIHFVGATPDLSHVVIASNVALTGPSSASGLYDWAAGALQLVSVLPGGTPAKGLVELGYSHDSANAISGDGSRIIWTTAEEEPKLGHLYMRDTATGETIQLDAAQGIAEPHGRGTARFQTASSDGSRVFFTDKQRLTDDSTAEPTSNRPDLYECEMVEEAGRLGCKLTDLTVDQSPGANANVQGLLLGTSEDGASAYLVAQGVLAGNENGNGETAAAGKDNLYEVHYDGIRWTTTFIAVLSGEDNPEWEGNRLADTAFLTARVSPSGRYLAFMSAASVTGYDNVDANPEAKGARDEEVYLYDASNASLRCVSCDTTGARPTGVFDTEGVGEGLGLLVDRRKVWFGHWLAGNIPGWTAENLTSALVQSRYLSDDGRLFFNSTDDLVPQAINHKEDVYEYEPAGLGSCESTTGGCVALISSGSSSKESAFIEATPEGSSVFFVTAAQLLPPDTDTAFDIYDARECTQVAPCLTPPSPAPAGCGTADACRPATPSEESPVSGSGSATSTGSGNIAQPPHAKQEIRGIKTHTKSLSRAQELSNALKSCEKQHPKKKRRACEERSRKRYGARSTKAKANKKASTKRSSSRRSAGGGAR